MGWYDYFYWDTSELFMMKIVADENIPLVEHYFGRYGTILQKRGRSITQADVKDADILLVRAVTNVNKELLQQSNVKFVGSTTTGFDHLDMTYLESSGIRWGISKGCNATAVVEYVICVIASLQKMGYLPLHHIRAGVIGVGNIGRHVVKALEILGCEVVQCDPVRAEKEPGFHSTSLKDMADLDLITLHTPLTVEDDHPTYHLIRTDFVQRQKKNCALINTSRGSVVDLNQLKMYGQEMLWCLDVWENEPYINYDALEPALIATPHIAGYSMQSKDRGIKMIYRSAVEQGILPNDSLPDVPYATTTLAFEGKKMHWRDVVLDIFDPTVMTQLMKDALLEDAKNFDLLRKNFTGRYEFEFVSLQDIVLDDADRAILTQLGVTHITE